MANDLFNIKKLIRDRRRLTIFLFCVAVSFLSWLLLSLNKQYSDTVVVPVKYINFPENKTLLNSIPDHLAVNVSGTGYDLLQYDGELSRDTLVINLDNLKMSVFGDYQRGYLEPSILGKSLQKRLNGALAINQVLTDSIAFLFDLKVSRIVAVKPMVNYQIANGYTLTDSVRAEPAEVEVFGPLSVLDTLNYVKTELKNLGEVKGSIQGRFALEISKFGNDALTTPDSVTVWLEVDRLTEKRFMLAPTMLHVPDSLEMLAFPNNVEVVVSLPMNAYDLVTEDQFEVQIDYREMTEGYPVLPVNLERWPPLVKSISVQPQQVEIVLTQP